jgi:FG-GAP repeat
MGGTNTAAEGDTVFTGAIDWPDAESSHCCRGAVYVWTKPAGGWQSMTQTARLTASDGHPGEQLGASLGVSGNTLVAGSGSGGALHIYTQPASGVWQTTSQFTAELRGASLGPAVAIQGHTIIGGAPGYLQDTGAIYYFFEPAGGWKSTSKYNLVFTDPANQTQAFFGNFIALQSGFSVAGAYLEKPTGAAYIYGSQP